MRLADIRQSGAALIIVLLALSLISLLAVQSHERIGYHVSRLTNQQALQQAYWYAMGAEVLAKEVLYEDIDSKTTHLGQAWATQRATFPIEGGVIRGQIEDLQRCFNLNALARGSITSELPLAHRVFNALLDSLQLAPDQAEALRERARDWMDADFQPTGFQGVEFEYQRANGRYLVSNQLMVDISEAELLGELDMSGLAPLWPFLCVLPGSDTLEVNVNTLTAGDAELLYALLSRHITLDDARQIIAERPDGGFESLAQLWDHPLLKNKKLSAEEKAQFSLKSYFFRGDIEVNYLNVRRVHRIWLKTSGNRMITLGRQYGESL
jgi:general secretion pathway protein K